MDGGFFMSKYPKSYIQYLAHFHGDRDYFECHEILEEYWKATDTGNKSSIWVAFILLAVSNYHYRRKNFAGAKRTLKKAQEIFNHAPAGCQRLGIEPEALSELLKKRERSLNGFIPYTSINLPIADPELLKLCQQECKENGFQWGSRSDLNNEELINRHSSRDRSEVITERKMALDEKNRSRKK
jgi:uncharacterized protein